MFGKIAAIRIGLVLAGASLFLMAAIVSAQQPTQEGMVRSTTHALLQAINAEDTTAAMNQLTATTVVDGFGFCPGDRCVGQTMKAAIDSAVAENVRLRIIDGTERVIGDLWISEVELQADSISMAGTNRLLFQMESQVKEGKIIRLRFTPELDDPQTVAFLGTGTPASVAPGPVKPPATGDAGLLLE
jgi:hypothetical protein